MISSSFIYGSSRNEIPFEIEEKNSLGGERLFHHTYFNEQMNISEGSEIYYIDAVDIPSAKRESIVELLFETYSCGKVVLGYRPLLAGLHYVCLYADSVDVSGVVVDLGKPLKITPIVTTMSYVYSIKTHH